MRTPVGARQGRLLLKPGLCQETPLSAEGEILEAKRLKIHDEKQRKQHGESPRERDMDGYCCRRRRKQGGEVIA